MKYCCILYLSGLTILLWLSVPDVSYAKSNIFQCDDSISQDTVIKKNKRKIEERTKKGLSWGGVPVVAYDSDIGFKYGAVINLYHYGDGSYYPEYKHKVFIEWSRTTKGSGINQFLYDSKYLIPKSRVTFEASYFTEQALNFYGFNGYNSIYNQDFEDDESMDYKSRMYYRLERKLLRVRLDLEGDLIGGRLMWLAGFSHYKNKINNVDIDKLNKDLSADDTLPHVNTLYDDYVEWGFINSDEKDGGTTNLVKLGLIYDTRDNEPNPMKGLWSDLQIVIAPRIFGNGNTSYARYIFNHRQYFTIVEEVLNFAGRISYQGKLCGDMPFYMLPFVYNTPPKQTRRSGIGGAKTVRGILRNRILGEDYFYGNLELRWKLFRAIIMKQNVYIALSAFLDGGMVTRKYDFNDTDDPAALAYLNSGHQETLHMAGGGGIHLAINQNFIITADYGRSFDERDGVSGLYLNFDFLY
jgi:outer membrane protein assembly factor BamA